MFAAGPCCTLHAVDDTPSPRRRGLRLLVIAVLLLAGGLVLLALLRPAQGAYPGWAQVAVHIAWVIASLCVGVGGFHALVGAPGSGVFALVRIPIAIAFGLGTLGALAIGGFVLHAAMSFEGSRSDSSSSNDLDWDFD